MVEVKQELAAVKAEMERRVDQLHSQLHYWQNVTVNILKDHCSSIERYYCTNRHRLPVIRIFLCYKVQLTVNVLVLALLSWSLILKTSLRAVSTYVSIGEAINIIIPFTSQTVT